MRQDCQKRHQMDQLRHVCLISVAATAAGAAGVAACAKNRLIVALPPPVHPVFPLPLSVES